MPVFDCEHDLLANLIVISPKNARRQFRTQIFEIWNWKCAYCDEGLTATTATIDHIIPKFKGGHHVRNNMCCCCYPCNRSKGSTDLDFWYTPGNYHYCKERLGKLKRWMVQDSYPANFSSTDLVKNYLDNGKSCGQEFRTRICPEHAMG